MIIADQRRINSRIPLHLAFAVAACSLVLVFAAAGTPIPMYNLYRAQDGITNADLGMVSVGYFVAAAVALLVLGRVSNHVGRTPVAIAALVSAAVSCLLLLRMHSMHTLLVARVLQGLACGIASSGLGAYVVDSAPARPRWLAAVIAGSAPMVGIPLGAIACGAFVEHAPYPRTLIYEVTAAILAVCAVLMALSPETMPRHRGLIASLRPRLQIPAGAGRVFAAAAAAFVATWSLGGFYQAFGPSIVAEHLGNASPLVAAAAFASVMVLNPIGGALAGQLSPLRALTVGMLLFMVTLAGIIASLHAGAIAAFIVASLAVGIAQGLASTGGIRALLSGASAKTRAGLLSTIYLVSYSGAAIPAMIAGRLTGSFDLFQIALGYAALGIAAGLIAIVAARGTPIRSAKH